MSDTVLARQRQILADIDAALARQAYEAATALSLEALLWPDARLEGLRHLVQAALGAGRLDDAARHAAQLVKSSDVAADIVLEGVVALGRGRAEQAVFCFGRALDMDATHPLAAVGLYQAASLFSPALIDILDRVIPALCWNAETNETCLGVLRGLVASGAIPAVAYPCGGRIDGIAGASAQRAELRWNDLVVAQMPLSATLADARLCPFSFTVPTDLAGRARFDIIVDGGRVLGAPLEPAATQPPRLMARAMRIAEGEGGLIVRAWDAACPARPVALDLLGPDGQAHRLVFRPEPGAKLADAQTVPILAPEEGVRGIFPSTQEPVYWPASAPRHRPGSGVLSRDQAPPRPIDVIVPIYGDEAVTRACLSALRDSLVGAYARPWVHVILIADAPADAAVVALVAEVEAQGWATVLRNACNLGFVRTVNRGMALHSDRDVVLLNADAMVHGDWLHRLTVAAYQDAAIGTVTPLSNDATILSYPDIGGTPLANTPIPFLDDLAAATLAGQIADVPTGVGFCFYIRRDCLDDVGYFDAEMFGQGYGEENDFCWRARARGWRNVAALDIVVGHVGGSSFGAEKLDRIATAMGTLNRLHPDYEPAVHAFIAADPLLPARRALDLAWAQSQGPRNCLVVCPVLGGGTDRFVDDQVATLTAEGVGVVLLRAEGWQQPAPEGEERRPAKPPRVFLEIPGMPQLRSLVYEGTAGLPQLMLDLRALGVERMVVHHVMGVPSILLDMLAAQWPYEVHAHDYVWICPRINLVDGSDRYCREPSVSVCETCVLGNGHRLHPSDLSVTTWRRSMAAFLVKARRVICPTQDTARRLAAHLAPLVMAQSPGTALPLVVRPHPDLEMPATPLLTVPAHPSMVRVAVVGAIGVVKGYDVLLDCARDAQARNLPLEFLVVGYTKNDTLLFETGRVRVTGAYTRDETLDLLRAGQSHLGFLPSIWPETWSYTLTEMLAAGLTVAAFDLGAQAERLRHHGRGMLMPLGATSPRINDALLELARRQGIVPAGSGGSASP
ncbi:glycosyltransferase [Nitrospirillum sp. BR 11828]|uniref:glycosyltransferase n=1 Tax=Nitrospirillum sp. BR 11828 TaxID=3104325 RepID=UPI002ACAECD1|nr:glycosyltransferase [Nitrospirillum sp. BR 11828]MDZ5650664.1 glycosyltransferase [Nitrospirillum sp. BR 11828]